MSQTQLDPQWLLVTRLFLALAKYGAEYLGKDIAQASSRDVIICAGVYIGQAEGRPMTSAKLADFIAIPRATVVRRLRDLQAVGKVAQITRNRWIIPTDPQGNCEIIERLFAETISHIHSTASQLSKMDNVNIA